MSTIAPSEDRHRQPMPQPKQTGPKAGNWFALLIIGSLAVFIIPMAMIVAVAMWTNDDAGTSAPSSTINLTVEEFAINGSTPVPAGEVTLPKSPSRRKTWKKHAPSANRSSSNAAA